MKINMSEYYPDKWVVVKIGSENLHKVFASWYGGYLGSDTWRLNSGIAKVIKLGDVYFFEGYSGSIYECRESNYGFTGYGALMLDGIIDEAAEKGIILKILPEETNWMEINYVKEQSLSLLDRQCIMQRLIDDAKDL